MSAKAQRLNLNINRSTLNLRVAFLISTKWQNNSKKNIWIQMTSRSNTTDQNYISNFKRKTPKSIFNIWTVDRTFSKTENFSQSSQEIALLICFTRSYRRPGKCGLFRVQTFSRRFGKWWITGRRKYLRAHKTWLSRDSIAPRSEKRHE